MYKVRGWASSTAVVMMILFAAVVVVPAVVGQSLTPSQCNNEKNNLKNMCKSVLVILGGKPSEACCQLVRAAHVECVCPFVSSKLVAAVGGQARLIRLIQSCSRAVPRNFKCGSVTTPP